MKTKIILLGATLVVVGISILVGWRALRTTRLAETERAALLAAHATRETEIRRLEKRLETATQERTELETTLAAARAAAIPTKVATGKDGTSAPGPRNPAELLASDPKLQAMSIAAKRAEIATTYGPYILAHALTDEQVKKFTEAKVKWFEQTQDLDAVMLEQKLPRDDSGVQALRKRADDELQAAVSETLGELASAELKNYESTLPMRAMVERFAGAAALGDVPLTLQQAEQLTQIMAGAAGQSRGGGRIDPRSIDWSAVDTKAQSVLSPEQLSLFQRIEPVGGGPSRWMARLNQAMQEATRPARAGG
jgi:hypothetical protein